MDDIDFYDTILVENIFAAKQEIPPMYLLHYTSPAGLDGIRKEKGYLIFRFTDKNDLEDTTEGKTIAGIYKEACKECYEEGLIDKSFYSVINGVTLTEERLVVNKVTGMQEYSKCRTFIGCFTMEESSEYMRNNYSGGALKCCLQLNGQMANAVKDEGLKNIQEQYGFNRGVVKCVFCKVLYKAEDKKEFIKDALKRYYDIFKKHAPLDEPKTRALQRSIDYFLYANRFLFKNIEYFEEKEYRICVSFPKIWESEKDLIKTDNEAGKSYIEIKLRDSLLLDIV